MRTPVGWVLIAELAVLAGLVAIAAILAASEIALVSVNRIRVRRMVEEGTRGASRLERLLEHPSRFLPVILLLTLLVGFAANSLAVRLAEKYLGRALGVATATVLATMVMTVVIFVYAEIAPKTVGSQRPEKVSLALSGLIEPVTKLVYPLAKVFIWAANPVVRLFGAKSTLAGPFVTEEEIKTIVTVGEEEGVIEEEEKEMIHSIFEFGDTVVREVMVPRTDMQAIADSSSLRDALGAVVGKGHSRVPVFEESLDDIVGLLYAKDLLMLVAQGGRRTSMDEPIPRSMLREAYFVPETKRVSELLRDMQMKQVHMAIVIDEYGGVAGLVTLEDLLEEIVGEIVDEYDIERPLVRELPDGRLRVDARLPLEELAELTSAALNVDDVDSVGGLVFALAGDIPTQGDTYELAGLRFRVERVEGRRIREVVIERLPLRPSDEEHESA